MNEPLESYPLTWPAGWPRTPSRKGAQFGKGERVYGSRPDSAGWISRKKLTVNEGIQRVLDELGRLGVKKGDAIISTNMKTRLDGLPYSDQRAPADPGVAVYWRAGNGAMKVMAVDRYDRVADNLAAVAATLEAMRAIERHGGAQILERAFTGFTALPGVPSCWDVLGLKSGASADEIERAFRGLARKHHPDVGGNHDEFIRAQTAREQALEQAQA